MAKKLYVEVGGKTRKAKKGYVSVDGKARKIKKAYVGVAKELPTLATMRSLPEEA